MKNAYFSLLKQWCDALIDLQITENKRREFYGGILCPSCIRVHGRCGDAVYPLLYMADQTGEAKYVEAAKLLFDWAEYNMTRPDGCYLNDTNSWWRGITVFATVALSEAVHLHGHLLDDETRGRWVARIEKAADFLYDFIGSANSVINYPTTCSASLATAYRVVKKEKYATKARELARFALAHVTEDGLIYGEGKPNDAITKKGCRPIDIGYNVEESLGALATYATVMNDEEVLEKTMELMRNHAFLMLEDGGWDNSFGSRSNKWTYWGSRTSDGCQVAFGLLADKDPLFAEVAYRNFRLLERCTNDGLLHGGVMYVSAGEPPCSHHTFEHTKALATLLDHYVEPTPGTKLPIESFDGIKRFPSLDVYVIHEGEWRATVSSYDFDYVPDSLATGGALTLLWNAKAGPLVAATMAEYQLVEANNMQTPRYYENIGQTPRIEYKSDGVFYRSTNDRTAVLASSSDNLVTAKGKLLTFGQEGTHEYTIAYDFTDGFSVTVTTTAEDSIYRFPVISKRSDSLVLDANQAVITTDTATIHLTGSVSLEIDQTIPERVFNPIGGFETVHFMAKLPANTPVTLTLTIS